MTTIKLCPDLKPVNPVAGFLFLHFILVAAASIVSIHFSCWLNRDSLSTPLVGAAIISLPSLLSVQQDMFSLMWWVWQSINFGRVAPKCWYILSGWYLDQAWLRSCWCREGKENAGCSLSVWRDDVAGWCKGWLLMLFEKQEAATDRERQLKLRLAGAG